MSHTMVITSYGIHLGASKAVSKNLCWAGGNTDHVSLRETTSRWVSQSTGRSIEEETLGVGDSLVVLDNPNHHSILSDPMTTVIEGIPTREINGSIGSTDQIQDYLDLGSSLVERWLPIQTTTTTTSLQSSLHLQPSL